MRLVLATTIGLDLALAAVVAWSAQSVPPNLTSSLGARALLDTVEPITVVGNHVAITDSLRSINQTVRVDSNDLGMVLDSTRVTCHGGRARVTWHVGNLEPTFPRTGIGLTARLDGELIGSLLQGSTDGLFNDSPASIMAVVDCPAGEHVIDLVIAQIDGAWGIPYVVDVADSPARHLQMNRGFIVMEVW